MMISKCWVFFFCQAEDGIRDLVRSRGLGDVYKRQVIGRPHDETIILNHALLYLPASDRLPPINQASRLDEIRQLLLQGKYAEAAKIPVEIGETEGYQGTHWTDPYMPALNIRLNMKAANVRDLSLIHISEPTRPY